MKVFFLSKYHFTRRLLSICIAFSLFFLVSCGNPTPPRELAPNGDIIQKAILLQLRYKSDRVSESLDSPSPDFKIEKINVKELQPVYVEKLAAYHLQGDFDLVLKLPKQKNNRQHNDFDIYIQRQREGKTWRLLRKEVDIDRPVIWRSYLIE